MIQYSLIYMYRNNVELHVQCTCIYCISICMQYLADPWTQQIHFPNLHQHQHLSKTILETLIFIKTWHSHVKTQIQVVHDT